ncbi:sodium:solute symporter family protein [Vulcanisaeta thermophila]|uniref:sodium:solute symporter family protein n=1 Tax=Vulcanisaeta thermophila TaxID=867917 RepID=UPI000852CB36|nr:sodium:solute symporter [Vulcanisaeta thermophila]
MAPIVTPLDWGVFLALFVFFTFLGFYGARWRRGDLSQLSEWALAGRRLGVALAWFLVGADVYTAYTFIAVPSGVFATGALYFYAVPYVATTFGVAAVTMPALWRWSRKRGYITAADFVQDRFNSKLLAAFVAITGIIAEFPYIALQIVGLQAVLTVMLLGIVKSIKLVSDLALTISFIVLAAFTYTSGLRGATLTAVLKDVIIFASIIAILVAAPLVIPGAFSTAFKEATLVASGGDPPLASGVSTLKAPFFAAYTTLWVGSTLALYLYPHSINGSLSAESDKRLTLSLGLLPIYGIGLALLALYGILIYGDAAAMKILSLFPASARGSLVIPTLAVTVLPPGLAGLALLGVFIGGLVPAAIMAMAQANLLVRNIIKPLRPSITPQGETRIAKWASVFFKFLALGFVFIVPATYAIWLQLLGGIIITQTLPAVFLGLVTDRFDKYSLMVGWAVGLGLGVYLFIAAHESPLYPILGHPIYIAVIALAINLLIVLVGTGIAMAVRRTAQAKVSVK